MVEKSRAAKDGNEFHETWAARRSLELLMPRDELVGIAVEGFSTQDGEHVSSAASEIADLVLYYGDDCSFESAKRVEVSQFKYSIANQYKPFVASDAKQTFEKFAEAERDHRKKFGKAKTERKLRFSIVTNRPIDSHFSSALSKLAEGADSLDLKTIQQANQIYDACGLSPVSIQSFLSRLELRGATGSLIALKSDVSTRIVDWSVSADYVAHGRLGSLKALLRSKAGTEGQGRNVVRLVDVLSALGVADDRDLLPAPASFVDVGPVVARPDVENDLILALRLNKPVLVHAAGGVGKTVFMQGLASRLMEWGEVVLFDCFGGGNYRSVEDSRHLPIKGLLHIVNALASRGLCDPIIPGPVLLADLLSTARRRFNQAITTLRIENKQARLFILLDAADNAAQQGIDQHEKAFPTLLMETFSQLGTPDGVGLIASCRTERIEMTAGTADPVTLPLPAFTRKETRAFLSARVDALTDAEIDIAQVRSEGNARVLNHLVEEWDALIRRPDRSDAPIQVEELIQRRLDRAMAYVAKQGLNEAVRAFLCGLTVLPPPVPVSEYAAAIGLSHAAIESFAADLAPLLDRTSLGIVFRDEPTETFVRTRYGNDPALLAALAQRLTAAQKTSAYAARALPRLLNLIGAADMAVDLAFSDDLPSGVTSDFGKRAIRTHRLTTALAMSSRSGQKAHAIRLLVELASVAASGDRLDDLIASHPDLVAAAADAEALRRLFEVRTTWPGARHARLTIAHLLMGDESEAALHAERSFQWLRWYYNQDNRDRSMKGPTSIEAAARSIHLASKGQLDKAFRVLGVWRAWFGFLVAKDFLRVVFNQLQIPASAIVETLRAVPLEGPAIYAACIETMPGIETEDRSALVALLAQACRAKVADPNHERDEHVPFENALLLSAGIALRMGSPHHARSILAQVHIRRPSYHTFQDNWPDERVARWLLFACLSAVASGGKPTLVDILSREARESLPKRLKGDYSAKDIEEKIKRKASLRAQAEAARGQKSTSEGYESSRAVSDSIAPLLPVCELFSTEVLTPPKAPLFPILDAWVDSQDGHSMLREATRRLRDHLGRFMALFSLQLGGSDSSAFADQFVAIISTRVSLPTSVGVDCLRVLSYSACTSGAGQALLPWLDKLLEREDDASRKGDLLADIATILLGMSPEDGVHYFQRSMQQLNSLGSADYETVQDLMPLLAKLEGSSLPPENFQRFANLCEMNFQGEPSKFAWNAFAQAAVPAQGIRSLAQIGRWCSREAVDFGYCAPPLIVELVRSRRLCVDSALALLTLDEVGEAHWFSWGDIAAVLMDAEPTRAEQLAFQIVRKFEKDQPSTSSSYSYERLREAISKRLPITSAALAYLTERVTFFSSLKEPYTSRVADLGVESRRYARQRAVKQEKDEKSIRAMGATCPPLDIAAIAASLRIIKSMDGAWDARRGFCRALAKRVPIARRSVFVDLLTEVEGLELDLRLDLVEEILREWEGHSPALRARRKVIYERVLVRHAAEFVGLSWGFSRTFERIAKLGGMPHDRAALVLASNLTQLPVASNARHWLQLAVFVAEGDDGAAVQLALNRLLGSSALAMAGDFGDGAFRADFDPGLDEDCIVAGLIWTRLASVDAFDRWRAAHAIRNLIDANRLGVIDELVRLFRSGKGGPFLALSTKFHLWDARLWLLVALARAAKDHSQLVDRYQSFLLEEAFTPATPHVLMQSLAVNALLCAQKDLADTLELKRLLVENDPARGPRVKYPRTSGDPYRPAGVPASEFKFSLDYDFRKHETRPLGAAFGVPAWKVAELLEEQASSWDPQSPGMYDQYGRHSSGRRSSADGRFRSYGAHLGWHALFVVAGRLRATRSLAVVDEWDRDPWREFIDRHALSRIDGLWLSDGTDPYPAATNYRLRSKGSDGEELTSDVPALLNLAGISDKKALPAIVAEGVWESGDDVKIYVHTAMIKTDKAIAACSALAAKKSHDVWLPRHRQYRGSDQLESDPRLPFEAWIVTVEASPGWDEFDPFCSTSAITRPMPDAAFRTLTGVSAADPFARSWINKEGDEVMRSIAWGERRGYGEHERKLSAEALLCEAQILRKYLAATDRSLVVLVRIERYTEKHSQSKVRYRSNGAVGVLTASGALVFSAAIKPVERTSDW